MIALFSPVIILIAAHMAGVEKASVIRSVVIALFGLFLLVLFMLPVALNLAQRFGVKLPITIPVFLNLPFPQLIAIYLVAWIVLIKLGFESSFLDAFTVGVSSAGILLMVSAIVLFLTSVPFST